MILKIILFLINFFCKFSLLHSQSLSENASTDLDNLDLKQVLEIFETNYKKAKIDPYLTIYKNYFISKINDERTINKIVYQEHYKYFEEIEKSYILFYKRNPVEGYLISFPNEDYYLWRIKVINKINKNLRLILAENLSLIAVKI